MNKMNTIICIELEVVYKNKHLPWYIYMCVYVYVQREREERDFVSWTSRYFDKEEIERWEWMIDWGSGEERGKFADFLEY